MKKPSVKYFFLILFALVIIASVITIWPLITTLLTSILVAYVFYPVYKFLYEKTGWKNISSLIICILIFLIVVVPVSFIANTFIHESTNLNLLVRQKLLTGNLFDLKCNDEPTFFCTLSRNWQSFISDPDVRFYFDDTVNKITNAFVAWVSKFVIQLPTFMIQTFVFFFLLFYFFRDGYMIMQKIKEYIPLKKVHQKNILNRFGSVTKALVYGHIITAMIQGLAGGIGFFIFGVKGPIFWGFIMGLLALLPIGGAAIVWVPAGLLQILLGADTGQDMLIWKGLGLLIYGLLFISTIDNFIRPKIIGHHAEIHPAIILLGLIGGIVVFGPVGLFIGPLILALLLTFIEIYNKEKHAL